MEQNVGDILAGLRNQDLLGSSIQFKGTASNGNYHPHRCPPDLLLATKHAMAKRVKISQQRHHLEGRETCPCCGLHIEGELIPLTAGLDQFYHIGCGYSLYFHLVKYCLCLIGIVFVISSIYSLASDIDNGDCLEPPAAGTTYADNATQYYCLKDYITTFTIANKRNNQASLENQSILNLLTLIIMKLFFQYIRYMLRKYAIIADDETISPSDYTIKLSGVASDVKTQEIKDWMESYSTPDQPIVVRKINRSYDIVEYTQLTRDKDTLQHKIDNAKTNEEKDAFSAQIKAVHEKLHELKKNNLSYARVVYVTFTHASASHYIEDMFHRSFFKKGFHFLTNAFGGVDAKLHPSIVKAKRAPEPSGILWEHLGFDKQEKTKRKHFTTLMTVVAIIIGFCIVLGFAYGQSAMIGPTGSASGILHILSLIASIIIVCINFGMGMISRKLSEYEKHGTYTGYFTGVARKLAIAQFLNTAITVLVARTIVRNTIYFNAASDGDTTGQPNEHTYNYYGKGGLLETEFFVFISNALCTPLMNFFDPFFFLFKYMKRKSVLNNPDTKSLDQKEANALFEGTALDMSYKYSILMKTNLVTMFYAPAMPFALIFGCMGVSLVYWVDKYLLLRRAALPYALGDELSTVMVEYLEWIPTAFGTGNLIFTYTLKNDVGEYAFNNTSFIIAWVMFAIGLIHVFIPMKWLNKKLFKLVDEVTEYDSYDKARPDFVTDYDIENPITRHKGLEDLSKALERANNPNATPNTTLSHEASFADDGGSFQHLDCYIKGTHENPASVAHDNQVHSLAVESQRLGATFVKTTGYKPIGNVGLSQKNYTKAGQNQTGFVMPIPQTISQNIPQNLAQGFIPPNQQGYMPVPQNLPSGFMPIPQNYSQNYQPGYPQNRL